MGVWGSPKLFVERHDRRKMYFGALCSSLLVVLVHSTVCSGMTLREAAINLALAENPTFEGGPSYWVKPIATVDGKKVRH
jgi:hypothetical protein